MIKIIDNMVSKKQSLVSTHNNNRIKSYNKRSSSSSISNIKKTANYSLPIYIQRFVISLLFNDSKTTQYTKLSISLISKKFLELSIQEMNHSTTVPISISYRYNFNSNLSLLKSNVKYLNYSFTYKKKYRHYFYHDYDERLNEELELININYSELEILDLRKCEINSIHFNIFSTKDKYINLKQLLLSVPKNNKIINEKQKELNEINKRISIKYINEK
ncbi:expressed protein [Dictyostelium purpureum]|uniref:Expressed protein n=1 Tax=Dictyostelium purpureum TaxID=5786 RepID=F0ZG84_DICPU|nr:uncharacterized protein DICPUDRAFT_94163 [Dictyostelium purpureum]EGC37074.1 expressed protein [Dictyostelium purpureum]|eukprot:XP_003286431.1 expressed protein [Dictyostelium purpureum]